MAIDLNDGNEQERYGNKDLVRRGKKFYGGDVDERRLITNNSGPLQIVIVKADSWAKFEKIVKEEALASIDCHIDIM